jgi:glyceraldehyde-3-phosphate dehydrogenase/erythrose-4-phosphate dehydrogenase
MTRVAINGFGRSGRNFRRAYLDRPPGRCLRVFENQLTMADGATQ